MWLWLFQKDWSCDIWCSQQCVRPSVLSDPAVVRWMALAWDGSQAFCSASCLCDNAVAMFVARGYGS